MHGVYDFEKYAANRALPIYFSFMVPKVCSYRSIDSRRIPKKNPLRKKDW